MRQLHIHEYLALLDGNVRATEPTATLQQAALHEAQLIWPQLKIGYWTDRERKVEYVGKCLATGTLLVHVSADWENSFLILVVSPGRLQPDAYILFDIGAEYAGIRFICPTFDIDEGAIEETIRKFVPLLEGRPDPYAILERADGTYLQTIAEDGMFDVEHQLVSLSSHYCLEKRVDAQAVVEIFLSYAFGKKEWAREHVWTKMDL